MNSHFFGITIEIENILSSLGRMVNHIPCLTLNKIPVKNTLDLSAIFDENGPKLKHGLLMLQVIRLQ